MLAKDMESKTRQAAEVQLCALAHHMQWDPEDLKDARRLYPDTLEGAQKLYKDLVHGHQVGRLNRFGSGRPCVRLVPSSLPGLLGGIHLPRLCCDGDLRRRRQEAILLEAQRRAVREPYPPVTGARFEAMCGLGVRHRIGGHL